MAVPDKLTDGVPMSSGLQGLASEAYARALDQDAVPIYLPRSGAWILSRSVPGTDYRDALGGYPFLMCSDWSGLEDDLRGVDGLVSIVAVPDPFGNYDLDLLHRCFPDRTVFFKDHHVADLHRSWETFVSRHHKQYAAKAARRVTVEMCEDPVRVVDEWVELYALAVQRFKLTGMRAPSRQSFERQLAVPGAAMSIARVGGRAVAAHLQFTTGDVAYAHLAASSEQGRNLGADYALYMEEIRFYTGRVRWIDWGGDAGISPTQGALSSFKAGWSTSTRPVYLCGRVLDRRRYAELSGAVETPVGDYFPAYRAGEFG